MHQTKLVNGLIPKGQECPFKDRCELSNRCEHKGKDHEVDFSCAMARAFDLIDSKF